MRTLMKGNNALAEAAILAGCRFFAGYPITPQTEILDICLPDCRKWGDILSRQNQSWRGSTWSWALQPPGLGQ